LTQKRSVLKKSADVVHLDRVRALVEPATALASWMQKALGAEIIETRPGRVIASFPERVLKAELTVRKVNPFRSEKIAYERARKPVPQQVLDDLERWEREHR